MNNLEATAVILCVLSIPAMVYAYKVVSSGLKELEEKKHERRNNQF